LAAFFFFLAAFIGVAAGCSIGMASAWRNACKALSWSSLPLAAGCAVTKAAQLTPTQQAKIHRLLFLMPIF
jgi:hypothetical protein